MRKSITMSSLVNDCISMSQIAGNIVRDTHFKKSLLTKGSNFRVPSGIKAAFSSNYLVAQSVA